jgi:hypothetical protein
VTVQIAKRIGRALGVASATKLADLDQALREFVRSVSPGATVPVLGSIDTSQVISGTFAIARIPIIPAATQISGATLGNFANDAAAAGGGVAVGSLYRNGSIVMVRVV